jgi:hypothetical protein
MTGRVIAAWPSFSLIAAYELLVRQVRRVTELPAPGGLARKSPGPAPKVVRATVTRAGFLPWALLVVSSC